MERLARLLTAREGVSNPHHVKQWIPSLDLLEWLEDNDLLTVSEAWPIAGFLNKGQRDMARWWSERGVEVVRREGVSSSQGRAWRN